MKRRGEAGKVELWGRASVQLTISKLAEVLLKSRNCDLSSFDVSMKHRPQQVCQDNESLIYLQILIKSLLNILEISIYKDRHKIFL